MGNKGKKVEMECDVKNKMRKFKYEKRYSCRFNAVKLKSSLTKWVKYMENIDGISVMGKNPLIHTNFTIKCFVYHCTYKG